jgi:hypothetical protein
VNSQFPSMRNSIYQGVIRGSVDRVDIIGYHQIHMGGIPESIDVWEQQERQTS